MHSVHNVLYEIKKEAAKRSSPLYQSVNQQTNLRQEIAQLRTKLRSKDTQIIRLQSKIDELTKKLVISQYNSMKSKDSEQQSIEKQKQVFSQIPMISENRQLKQDNQALHKQNLLINGLKNDIQIQLRSCKSELKRYETIAKEYQIIDKMRQERFKDQVQKLTPIVIHDNKQLMEVKQKLSYSIKILRQGVVQVIFQIFLKCAKECQKQKQASSFSIFKNYWETVKQNKNYGFLVAVKSYQGIRQLAKVIENNYGQIQQNVYRDTMNQWIITGLIDIKHSAFTRQKQQKLFRYLGLYYRSKFPIKGQNYQLDSDVKAYFEDMICQQLKCRLMDENNNRK